MKNEQSCKITAPLSRMLTAIKQAGVETGARNKTVAEKTGYSTRSVGSILSGNSDLTKRFTQAVCSAFGVRREWIEHGEEPVLEQKKSHALYIGKTDPEFLKRLAREIVGDGGETSSPPQLQMTHDETDRIDIEVLGLDSDEVKADRKKWEERIVYMTGLIKRLRHDEMNQVEDFIFDLLKKRK